MDLLKTLLKMGDIKLTPKEKAGMGAMPVSLFYKMLNCAYTRGFKDATEQRYKT